LRTGPVPARIATVYFRLVEDVLDSIRSHAEHSDPTITISLEASDAEVQLRIECEGADALREVEWLSLQQRVAAIGGHLSSRAKNDSIREFVARASA
jgi:glucose-6-phosphate-specific signal transduction histidine kinase